MSLRMIVTVKQVPDTQEIKGEAMTPEGRVNRAALPAIINPEDLNALEEALKLKKRLGGHLTVISMGPPSAAEALKGCFFRGADDVILLSDRNFAGADTLATSYTLKCAIDKVGPFDIVFCGRQAIDGDTAQVGPQLAEKLGINQITCVSELLEMEPGNPGYVKVKRATEHGYEILKSNLPLLITVTSEANIPRSPNAKRLLAFRDMSFTKEGEENGSIPDKFKWTRSHFKLWDMESLKIDKELCGMPGSPTKVKKIETITLTAGNSREIAPTAEGLQELIDELKSEHIIG